MSTHTSPIKLVTGATGKTGRRVVQRRAERGVAVRLGSRSAQPAFDWNDRATWAPALDGVSAVYLAHFPDLAAPGAADTVGAFAELAAARGMQRLVLLSGRGEPEAQAAEQLVRHAVPDTTIVRCSWFAQNFSEAFLHAPVMAGGVTLPADGVREPFVDVDDVADVAVAALTEDGHAGRLYELTGPRLLTFADAVAEIAAASERTVDYVPITLEQLAAGLAADGVPDDVAGLIGHLFGEVLDGRNEAVCDGVAQALARPPRDFAAYARDAAAAGAWSDR